MKWFQWPPDDDASNKNQFNRIVTMTQDGEVPLAWPPVGGDSGASIASRDPTNRFDPGLGRNLTVENPD